jgi:exopolysaccharide biosynthesis polyprenyl glycosylphosphotransferase
MQLSWLLRGVAYGSAHWRGPRRVNLTLIDTAFLVDADGTRLDTGTDAVLKRILDVSAGLLVLLLTLPLMMFAAVAIRVDGNGPILYRQERVGRRGTSFIMYKFRTMRADAEDAGGPQWAVPRDPRVTRIGGLLRRTRIDELPQIINVLKGEMSFVGPRPERPVFVDTLTQKIPFYAERHRARPGITGWAQINHPYGASIEDARQKHAYDLYYLKNFSILFDILIVLATPKAVFIDKGGR